MQYASAVRPLRTAVIDALKDAATPAGTRVYPGLAPRNAGVPYVTVGRYAEEGVNWFGRAGSRVSFDVKGYVSTQDPYGSPIVGDTALLALHDAVYVALHNAPVTVNDHWLLMGTLRLVTDFMDPDAPLHQFVARYEAETRVAA